MLNPAEMRVVLATCLALSLNMVLQIWLYVCGRFNFYLVLLCLGQFMSKLYFKWGRAFILGVKEAMRSRKYQLYLAAAAAAADTDKIDDNNSSDI
ncbi:unnamed protein product [Choristocarpus tenellus]